jgi:inner membrane protein
MEKLSFFKTKVGKGLLVGAFALFMFIPLLIVQNLVNERQNRKNEVVTEVTNQWSRGQKISGLIFQIPYEENVKQEKTLNGKQVISIVKESRVLYVSPKSFILKGQIIPEKRKKSIYEVVVYNSNLKITGSFDPLNLPNKETRIYNLEKAKVLFEVNDIRGLQKEIIININKAQLTLENSGQNGYLAQNIDLREAGLSKLDYSFDLAVRGSTNLKFNPTAANTTVELTSTWQDPGFFGAFLPSYDLDKNGFNAKWNVLELNRDFPRVFYNLEVINIADYQFGVNLVETANNYQKNERAVKYGLLIVSLTFLVFFFMEMLLSLKVNLIQYGLIGIALILFYSLLLSISEFLTFNIAYLISCIATIGLIFAFSKSLFILKQPALALAAILSILYGFIFIIIQLEDTALLIGSIGLFLILATTMYISRKVNWDN